MILLWGIMERWKIGILEKSGIRFSIKKKEYL